MDVREDSCDDLDILPSSNLQLYESQFFGFTPQTCMLRVYSAFWDCLCDILPVVETECVRQLRKGKSEAAVEQLRVRARECTRKLQHFLCQRFKQISEAMDALLVTRCLTIPPNVLLPEDQPHSKHPQDTQGKENHHMSKHNWMQGQIPCREETSNLEMLRLESSMTDLHRAYEAEVCARHALQAELEEQAVVQKQLDDFLTWIRELHASWLMEGNGSFQESFQLVTASVKKLQEAIVEVCNKAP
ncbi:protein MIS12 homolog isoform X1 [Entelurus aequoreus]|uniref:protein MIS12 homolog isoform X1 n=1 Tax=Entelurus aequoreus TaxID=161455 RepID=UPI002B1CFE95|nr:protein MIS12 homolog isoform X1 [Entelurus aequoreus]